MKKIIFVLSLFFLYNCVGLSQTINIGYKSDCYEYYPDTVYENLLSIIDTNTRNILLGHSDYMDPCRFKVFIELNTRGYLENIIIRDTCDLLDMAKKEEFKNLLSKIQFEICHGDYLLKDQSIKMEHGETMLLDIGAFSTWWYFRMILRDED